ncbi:hypothetical protein DFJ73DRAFT_959337 [Zopfochytrium polystomum]|nr:hypothetical protein DFJ73DRAFT_959337 [Zopfochytrium polystomum]
MASTKTIIVIGGTGAQGEPVVKALAQDGAYAVTVLTRDPAGRRAQELARIPAVTVVEGTFQDEALLKRLFEGAHGAYVNTDGFTIGEQAEVFWGMRIFELAAAARVKHFVWGALDYSSKIGGFDPKFRCGHYDGKGRVSEWLLAQNVDGTTVSVLTSGPYVEMLEGGLFVPRTSDDGSTLIFSYPKVEKGIPLIHLDDIGFYARWIFDNPARASHFDLKVATAHITFEEIVSEFNARNARHSRTAKYEPHASVEDWLDAVFPFGRKVPITAMTAASAAKYGGPPPAPGMTLHDNFLGFGNLWQSGRVTRDYALMDEIHPGRVKSIGEWMDKTGYDGSRREVLKSMSS